MTKVKSNIQIFNLVCMRRSPLWRRLLRRRCYSAKGERSPEGTTPIFPIFNLIEMRRLGQQLSFSPRILYFTVLCRIKFVDIRYFDRLSSQEKAGNLVSFSPPALFFFFYLAGWLTDCLCNAIDHNIFSSRNGTFRHLAHWERKVNQNSHCTKCRNFHLPSTTKSIQI